MGCVCSPSLSRGVLGVPHLVTSPQTLCKVPERENLQESGVCRSPRVGVSVSTARTCTLSAPGCPPSRALLTPRRILPGRAAFGAAGGLECAPVRLQGRGSSTRMLGRLWETGGRKGEQSRGRAQGKAGLGGGSVSRAGIAWWLRRALPAMPGDKTAQAWQEHPSPEPWPAVPGGK